MKRFLLISNIYPPQVRGGYELGCQTIAHQLSDQGHEVVVATSKPMPGMYNYPEDSVVSVRDIFDFIPHYEERFLQSVGQSTAILDERSMAFSGYNPTNALALECLLREFQPDVIWLFNPLGLGVLGILETALAAPSRMVWHLMDYMDETILGSQEVPYLAGRYRALKRKIHAIACSPKIAAAHARAGHFASQTVIFNGVIPPSSSPSRFGRSSPNSPFKFVYFGQISPSKGIHLLIDAFQRARRLGSAPKMELHFYGVIEDRYRTEFESEQKKPSLFYHGVLPRDQLMQAIGAYDAAVLLLGDREPFGYAPVEAVFYGLPCLVPEKAFPLFPKDCPLVIRDREDISAISKLLFWCATHREKLREWHRVQKESVSKSCSFTGVFTEYLQCLEMIPAGPYIVPTSPRDASFLIRSIYQQDAPSAPASSAARPLPARSGVIQRRFPRHKLRNMWKALTVMAHNILSSERPVRITFRK